MCGDSRRLPWGHPKNTVTLWKITRRKKGGILPCLMQSCVFRNARQAALRLVNATTSGRIDNIRKKPIKATPTLTWDAPKTIKDIENGLINCVITKDLSRLGRNYLDCGLYLEVFFPENSVRYIAVNDGVDTLNKSAMDITPFRNILNEMYCGDVQGDENRQCACNRRGVCRV